MNNQDDSHITRASLLEGLYILLGRHAMVIREMGEGENCYISVFQIARIFAFRNSDECYATTEKISLIRVLKFTSCSHAFAIFTEVSLFANSTSKLKNISIFNYWSEIIHFSNRKHEGKKKQTKKPSNQPTKKTTNPTFES